MIVSSPIGELPFTPVRLRYEERGLVMTGEMGAWPASVRIDTGDIGDLVRLVRTPALVAAAAAGAALLLGTSGRRRDH